PPQTTTAPSPSLQAALEAGDHPARAAAQARLPHNATRRKDRRPMATRLTTLPRYYIASHGLDTLAVNAHGTLFWAVRQRLDELQTQALAERNTAHGRRRARVLVETPWCLAGQPLLIRPHGGGNAPGGLDQH